MRPLSRGLTLKVVVPIVLSVIAVVGGGLTWLVLQQQQQLYAEQVSRLRVYARQMETVRNYILNLQPYVQHTSVDTVPMVAAIKAASLYQENFRDGTVIRTPSDKPRNPKNAADPWEKEQLERFRRNPELTEFWEITTLNGEKVLRYAMPVKVTQDCLTCHGFPVGEKDPFGYPKEGYKVGDIRALYSLYIPTAAVAAQTRSNLARVYGLGLALIALLTLAVTVTTRRTVTKPLAAVTAQLENIARGEGDLSRRLEYASRDEVGQLAQGFNSFMAKLAEMVRAIEGVAKSVAETSSEVADASTQTGEATQDVTANLEQLVQQATTQAERLAASRNDIKVLAEASAQVAENAAETAGLAHATAKAAGLGEEALKQAVSGMERISRQAVEAASAVRGLSERAMSIGEIVETIQAFARETNLLALNAAIEAARAGESGRGFAVVADQVRQLADDSSRAAGRIGEMIAQIQGQAKEASRVMEESTQSVEEGYRLIDRARASLQEITGAAHKTDERMQDIRAAAERLAERVRALAEAMEGLTLAAEEISNRAANIGAAAEEQMAAVEEIGASTSSLAAEAGKLRAMIERFKY